MGVAAAYLAVLYAHGLLPGLVNDGASNYLFEASATCVRDMGLGALKPWCHHYGEPLGYPFLTGGPAVVFAGLTMHLPTVDSFDAYLVAGWLFMAIALVGGYGLLRRLGVRPSLAMGGATLYLVTASVIGMRFFGGTFTGFTLLPAYAFVDLVVIHVVDKKGLRSLALAFVAYTSLKAGALFLDGYSFVAGSLVSVALWGAWILHAGPSGRQRATGVVTLVIPSLIALGLYSSYIPQSYEQNPVEIFRSMGLDVTTLVLPTKQLLLADTLGLATDHSDLWGDGTNSAFNYVGLVALGLAIAGLVLGRRDRRLLAVAAAGLAAMILALGPSLKVGDRPPHRAGHLAYESYLQPAGTAPLDFPWAGIFTGVPGVESMRATYRWFLVTRLAVVVLAVICLEQLARQGRRGLVAALLLGLLTVVELLPNLGALLPTYRAQFNAREAVSALASGDLRAAAGNSERVFFLNYDGSHNDYLANFLAGAAGFRTFNAGGDKNLALSRGYWPPAVKSLASANVTPTDISRGLESRAVDTVIVPFFHLRLSAYRWPPSAAERNAAGKAFASILADESYTVKRYRWFAALQRRRSGR